MAESLPGVDAALHAFDRAGAERILADAGHPPTLVRTLRGGPRPALGQLRPLKDLLVARLGPETAACAYAALAGHAVGEVRRLPIASLHGFAREHACEFEIISPATDIRMPALQVFGDASRRGFEARSRTVFRCVLRDAIVSSKSNVIIADDRVLLDCERDEQALVPLDLAVDPVLFAPEAGHATVLVEAGALRAPLPQAFTLLGVNSFNYWHWHIEFLPRLLACRDLPGFERIPVLVDAQMPAQSMQALRFVLGPAHPVRVVAPGEALRVERLWTCSMFMYLPLWPMPGIAYAPRTMYQHTADLVAQLRRLDPALAEVPARGPRRLYLGRGPSQHRGMANRVEVEQWFVAQGFEIVDFAALAFDQQLQHVRSADVIVGPNGAALVNTLFARPGTAIGVLDNGFVEDNEWYADLCAALGQRLLFLAGRTLDQDPQYEFNANYRIDVATLPAFLAALVDGGGDATVASDGAPADAPAEVEPDAGDAASQAAFLERLRRIPYAPRFLADGTPCSVVEQGVGSRPTFVLSIPKAGTYLIGEVLAAFGIVPARLHVDEGWASDFREYRKGTFMWKYQFEMAVEDALRLVQPGQFAVGHLPATAPIRAALQRFRTLFIHRELRHVLVSWARFVIAEQMDGEAVAAAQRLPDGPERVAWVLERPSSAWFMPTCRQMCGWLQHQEVLPLRFEDLVGDRGPQALSEAIARLVGFLGLPLSPEEAVAIARTCVGSRTLTFSGARSLLATHWDERLEQWFLAAGGPELNCALGYAEAGRG